MLYTNNGKTYKVESINLGGMCIDVNGTTITDIDKEAETFGYDWHKPSGEFSVFCDSDEIIFHSFEEAYEFAMTKQKNTFRI